MTRLTLSFAAPAPVVLTSGPSFSLAFPAPQAVTLQVQGIQGPAGSGGGGGGATNLSWDAATRTVASDTGTDAILTLADSTNAGLMSSASVIALASALQPGAIIPWANVSGKPTFATVATSGLASDLTGVLPAASFNDTTHGNRAGGSLHPDATTGVSGFMSGADKTKLNGIATGATANSADATLLARANHTGTQLASTISDFAATVLATVLTGFSVAGTRTAVAATDTVLAAFGKVQKWLNDLAAVAFSGSASDLSAGTLPAARMPALTGDATSTAGTTATTLATVNANTGSWGLAASVAQFTVNAKGLITAVANVAISIASTAISDSTAAGRAMLTAATAAAQTALLNVATTTLKGLVPAPGTASGNFLRDDLTWAASGGGSPITVQDEGSNITTALGTVNFVGAGVTVTGGATATVTIPGGGGGLGDVVGPASATDNALARFDTTTGKLIQNSAATLDDAGALTVPTIATPATPAAGNVTLFGRSVGGRAMPAIIGPSGLDTALQPHFGRNRIALESINGNATTVTDIGIVMAASTGTNTAASVATTNLFTMMRRMDVLVTVAATNAVAGRRGNVLQNSVGGTAAGLGGFHFVHRWGPATGVTNASHRAFTGMRGVTTAPTDVNPSTLTNLIGMGYDDTDTNIQFIYNDASGTASKVNLGASFPKPSADRTSVYEIAMFSPPGTTQSVSYEITNLVTGAVATGTVTTDLPATTQLLTPWQYISVGGVSSVVGLATMGFYIETDY